MGTSKSETYNQLFRRMIYSMTDMNNFDREEFVGILRGFCELFDLAKGVTEFYDSLSAERAGDGEIFIDYDNGKGDKVALFRRIITPSKTVIKSTIYKAADSEPLSEDDYEKVDLVVRTMLTFISRNRLQSAVEKLAFYDRYGYPNINYFMRHLETLNEKGELIGNTAIQFNLRHFSLINQEIGRNAGDIVIKNYYSLIKDFIGDKGLICRVGGDNFAAVFKNDLLKFILQITSGFPVIYDEESEKRVMVSACIGVYEIPGNYAFERPDDITLKIYSAAQDAKYDPSGSIVYYTEKTHVEKEKMMRVRRFFNDALANNEFKAFYQPKVDIMSGKIVGAEALCRWVIGDKTVPPVDFVPVLEQNTDICRLDFHMLDLVCKDIRRWIDEGKRVVKVSVNLSRKHLIDVDLIEHLLKIIDGNNVPHKYIEFELTETTTDVEFSDLKRIANGLRDEGITIAVDDFGVGYSSLNLIREIPWDVIKLDRCFVPSDENYGVTELMFRHVIAMALAMGLECVAEGVETEKQLILLKENDCRIAQGFYFDRPLPMEDFEKKLLSGYKYALPESIL